MIVKTGYGKNFKRCGKVVFRDSKVVWKLEKGVIMSSAFKQIQYGKNTYTPKDGKKYMIALANAFRNSSTVVMIEEGDENWFSQYSTL